MCDEQKDETAPINTDALASPTKATVNGNGHARNGSIANGHAIPLHLKHEATDTDGDKASTAAETPIHDRNDRPSIPNTASEKTTTPDAMTHDDEALRAENERLRRQVEELQKAQETQKEEAEQLHADLEESEAGREQAETQYQNLLGRVEKIRETLGDRLKRDRQELEVAKDRIEELEAQNEALRQDSATATATATAAEAQVKRLQKELDEMEQENEREQTEIRSRAQLSQQNWQREKDELTRQVQQLRMELDSTSGAMSEWEVIAMEERSVRETLTEKVADLEEQLAVTREQHQVAVAERDSQGNAVDSLQRALQEIQEARKHELREMVRESEVKLEEAEKRVQKAESDAEKAVAEARTLKEEVERTSPFEREVKEKNLLIGKLRHETIVLNDHLTKALRYIKKNKPEENVDRCVPPLLCTNTIADNLIPFTNRPQTSRYKPLVTVPSTRPVRPQEVPGPASHRRHAAVDGGAEGEGRTGPPRHLRQQPATALVALRTDAQHARPQCRVLLGADADRRPRVSRRSLGRLPRAKRRGSHVRVVQPIVPQGQHIWWIE